MSKTALLFDPPHSNFSRSLSDSSFEYDEGDKFNADAVLVSILARAAIRAMSFFFIFIASL
jgi:hypothetical protein